MREQLILRKVSRSFGKERVLKAMDMTVERGTITALLGPSGCGKSTALKIIAGLIRQDGGNVILNGRRMDDVPANRRDVGFVFQNYSLFPNMTARKNVEFGLSVKRTGRYERRKRAMKLLDIMGLADMENKKPSELSGGQQQRVALARALAIDPKILLLDEPFAALDTTIRRKLRRDLLEIQERLGFTSIFVTHDQEEAFEVGSEIAVMNDGKIEQSGRPRDLYDNPRTSFVAGFLGNVNSIVLPSDDGREMRWVMVRPEDVIINRISGNNQNGGVRGKLISYIFFGSNIEVDVLLENGNNLKVSLSKGEFLRKSLRRGDDLSVKIIRFRSFSS
jgi:putative spermidine/putrescine transport system ATP-binding protein